MTSHSLGAHFDELFLVDADPWQTRSRWYERRKRALTLAMLPRERYSRAFEPGCAAGELTAALAGRCDDVVATDASTVGVMRAQTRLANFTGVRVEHGSMPDEWPAGHFDLVVLSEIGYYLPPDALRRLVVASRSRLTDDGTLLACHWRRGAPDMLQSAEDVHAMISAEIGRRRVSRYEDDDLLLDVWNGDGRSVAQQESLA